MYGKFACETLYKDTNMIYILHCNIVVIWNIFHSSNCLKVNPGDKIVLNVILFNG